MVTPFFVKPKKSLFTRYHYSGLVQLRPARGVPVLFELYMQTAAEKKLPRLLCAWEMKSLRLGARIRVISLLYSLTPVSAAACRGVLRSETEEEGAMLCRCANALA